jgi:hypothetical protein
MGEELPNESPSCCSIFGIRLDRVSLGGRIIRDPARSISCKNCGRTAKNLLIGLYQLHAWKLRLLQRERLGSAVLRLLEAPICTHSSMMQSDLPYTADQLLNRFHLNHIIQHLHSPQKRALFKRHLKLYSRLDPKTAYSASTLEFGAADARGSFALGQVCGLLA